MAFCLLSTVLDTSFRRWRQSLSMPSSIFQKTIAWDGNFSTGRCVMIIPFKATKNAAILFLFVNNTWIRPDNYITPLITKVQIKYGGQHGS